MEFPLQGGPLGFEFVSVSKDLKNRIVCGPFILKVKYCVFVNTFF